MSPEAKDHWQPTAEAPALSARARLLELLRGFFAERQVLEVETPVFSRAGNTDPGLAPFQTTDLRWLRTSPEYPMKRLLAAGIGDIFEIGRVFRSGEAGRWHNPEFTLLEWYRVDWNFHQLMDEVAALVIHCSEAFGRRWQTQKCTYQDWVHGATGLDPLSADVGSLRRAIESAGVRASLEGLDKDGLLDLLVSHRVQPTLPPDALTLVSHYPASQAALARLCPEDPRVSERFEVFAGPTELANGYGELTNAAEQRQRFVSENERRAQEGRAVPLDEALLAALDHGLPACAGVALGVDRLLMVLTGAEHIQEVLAFPADRA